MGTTKRDGFYRRGKVWWTRDPVTKCRRSTGCTDLEAARRWRAARERVAADPAHEAAATSRLGDWISRWLAMKAHKASAATMVVARQKLGHAVRIFGAEAPLASITPGAVDDYVLKRRDEGVTDHTIVKELTHLVAVMRLAKRGGCYALDPDELRPQDVQADYTPRTRALTRAELAALLAELEPHRAAFVAVCVALGCRASEAFGLLPSDIGAESVFIRGTKTKASRRHVPILSLYRPLLEVALPYLPLTRWDNLRRGLIRACQRAGIEAATPNDLRRTHSTLLIEAGVDRDVVRRLLGHSSTAMVDRVYGQPKTGALGELAEAKLLSAAPLDPVQERHSSGATIANQGASFAIRTRDLRFTKLNSGRSETPRKRLTSRNDSTSAPASADEDPQPDGVTGTRTSQSASARAFRAQAWLWFARGAA